MRLIEDRVIKEALDILPRQLEAPSELKSFPEQISSLSFTEISDLHAHYQAWASYIADKLKYIKADYSLAELELRRLFRRLFLAIPKGRTQKEKELLVKSNNSYLELEVEVERKRVMVQMLEDELNILEKQIMTLRAELRRQEQKFS